MSKIKVLLTCWNCALNEACEYPDVDLCPHNGTICEVPDSVEELDIK